MKIDFLVKYSTNFGENIFITGNCACLGNNNKDKAIPLLYFNAESWIVSIDIGKTDNKEIHYSYFIKKEDGEIIWGGEKDRIINIKLKGIEVIRVTDIWNHAGSIENVFYTTAFQKVLFKNIKSKKPENLITNATHIFNVKAPLLEENDVVCISGNCKSLNNWDTKNLIILTKKNNWWTGKFNFTTETNPILYKYGIYNLKSKQFIAFETGENRILEIFNAKKNLTILHDGFINQINNEWKGTGVSIPVFSLRSKKGFGIGEFLDLKLVVDWAKKTGINLIQILPVNDTTATNTWTDSYPYAAISAFALNPVYINLEKLSGIEHKDILKPLQIIKKQLNEKEVVDYEKVFSIKKTALLELYKLMSEECFKSEDYKSFFIKNEHWLKPYAAFCFLRDKYKTSHFESWKLNSIYDNSKIERLIAPDSKQFRHVALHYFIQYHLHLQLLEASKYAHNNGIVLKGDIPIGIYRYGCDAWVEPELYNMNLQAGAPPDDFAVKGQNWGFPTYNWKKMQEDGFCWWRKRFEQMSHYFDTFRIDHILGFFRIWSIPIHAVEGILGRFYPAIPVSETEFQLNNIQFDKERYCKPYINEFIINEIFGTQSKYVKSTFLDTDKKGIICLKPEFSTQVQVEEYFSSKKETLESMKLKTGLFDIISNVILFEEPSAKENLFHFRISIDNTYSFKFLDKTTQHSLKALYNNYFYHRQDDNWEKEAMHKLPYLQKATNMLICGEDLGMVPHCVPDVMKNLGILSLEIQRMPKSSNSEFFHPKDAPYLSVVTPSTHDMSTIRGWWEEDRQKTQFFFNSILSEKGKAPIYCEPWINKKIINQHIASPAMWCIFQMQDLFGISEKLRRKDPSDERINIPANPKHYWQYRMHLNLEDLNKEDEFNNEILSCIKHNGR